MPTWDDVRARLRATRPLDGDDAGCMRVAWRHPDDPDERQIVTLEPGAVLDTPWLVLMAEVFERTCLDCERALRRNAGMAVGALVLLGERYFVRHALPLPTLVLSDVERAMQLIAGEAVRLRRAHRGASALPISNYFVA